MAKKIMVVHSISFSLVEDEDPKDGDPTVCVAVMPDGLLAESGTGEELHVEAGDGGVSVAPLVFWVLRRLGVGDDSMNSVSVPLLHTVDAMHRSLSFES